MNEHGIFFYPCAIMINHVQFSPLECANSRQDKKLLDTPLPSIEQAFSNLKDQVSHGIACGTKDMKIVVKLVYHRGDVNKTVEFFQITLLFFESNVELGFLNIFELWKKIFLAFSKGHAWLPPRVREAWACCVLWLACSFAPKVLGHCLRFFRRFFPSTFGVSVHRIASISLTDLWPFLEKPKNSKWFFFWTRRSF